MLVAAVWILLCILVGVWANRLNRIGFLWFLVSLVLSPLLMSIILLIGGKYESGDDIKASNDIYRMKKDAFMQKFHENAEENSKNETLLKLRDDIRVGKSPSLSVIENALSIM